MSPEIFALVRESVRAVAAIVVASIIMLGLLAIARDGDVASQIAASLENAITWGLPVIGAIVVALQIMSGYVQGREQGSAQQHREGSATE